MQALTSITYLMCLLIKSYLWYFTMQLHIKDIYKTFWYWNNLQTIFIMGIIPTWSAHYAALFQDYRRTNITFLFLFFPLQCAGGNVSVCWANANWIFYSLTHIFFIVFPFLFTCVYSLTFLIIYCLYEIHEDMLKFIRFLSLQLMTTRHLYVKLLIATAFISAGSDCNIIYNFSN